MTDRYVGPGGSDGASGLSWALRKETLNGVEDTPVVAGDTVYVGPGTYRETLTIDVAGSSGQIITYIADVTGENTDDVGGMVRITGSDDDETLTRAKCIYFDGSGDYRTFRGFSFDMASTYLVDVWSNSWDNVIFEDCYFGGSLDSGDIGLHADVAIGTTADTLTIRRCVFQTYGKAIDLLSVVSERNSNIFIENCLFFGGAEPSIYSSRAYGFTVKNCTFVASQMDSNAVETVITAGGNKSYVYNCLVLGGYLKAGNAENIVEDYNVFASPPDADPTIAITGGANSHLRSAIMTTPIVMDGFFLNPINYMVSPGSDIRSLACGQTPPSDDLFGITRPTTDSKKTRGAIQFNQPTREATTVPTGETESLNFDDAMAYQIFIPITGKQMRVSVQVNRETNYAGTLPQMVIKQPGQSNRTTTDTGSVGTWNVLSDQFTPASTPTFIVMELRSNNTATSGSYQTFFGKPTAK